MADYDAAEDTAAEDQPMDEADFLREAMEDFECACERENDNRIRGKADLIFSRTNKHWDEAVRKQREKDGRPCLTYDTLHTMIRQVVNDARQNKPAITVHPADSGADPETAEIISGLIRNIEVSSDADVAYDTAVEGATSNSFGYFRINTRYTDDDSFDQDIVFERIANPFSVYGDPYSEAADSADWNCAFVVQQMCKEDFRRKYKGAQEVDFDTLGYTGLPAPWHDDDQIMVAEYWKRDYDEKQIIMLAPADGSEPMVIDLAKYEAQPEAFPGFTPMGQPRTVRSHRVTQYMITGAEVLEINPWPGKYIPIVPVYGDEVNVDGKRELYSLVHFAIDASLDYDYWRTTATEMVMRAPKTPYIGEEGTFDADEGWSTANSVDHPYLEHAKGSPPPQRQPGSIAPGAEIQQAMIASNDIKATIGIYNAGLGAPGNETSGVAITARQREGDVSTFHFIDNLSRAIRHAGRILIDLIPKVYPTQRVMRILGQDMKPKSVQVSPDAQAQMAAQQQQAHMMAQQAAQMAPPDQQQSVYQQALQQQMSRIARIYDITAGKYDLTVKTGPSYTTQREAARAEIVEIIRAVPQSATVLGPMYLRNSDWPGAEEAADKIEQAQGGGQGNDPQIAQMQAALQQMQAENAALKADTANKADENRIKLIEAQNEAYSNETDRIRALSEANKPAPIPQFAGSA